MLLFFLPFSVFNFFILCASFSLSSLPHQCSLGETSGQGIPDSQVSFKTTSASALSVAKALLLEKSLLPELSLFLLLGGHTLLVYEQPVYYGS